MLGTGHSFNRIADTDGDLVSLDRLPRRVEIAPDGSTATIAAGMRYGEVAEELHTAGYALANLASLPHITVAGAVPPPPTAPATAALSGRVGGGPGDRGHRTGDVTELRRDIEADRLAGAVVGLGALGVVTR